MAERKITAEEMMASMNKYFEDSLRKLETDVLHYSPHADVDDLDMLIARSRAEYAEWCSEYFPMFERMAAAGVPFYLERKKK